MKKLFLLLGASFAIASVNAQENMSTMFSHSSLPPVVQARHATTKTPKSPFTNKHNTAAKTTTYSYALMDWFDYWGANASASSQAYYFTVYPDSNITDGTNYNFFEAMGMSFDPCDNGYYNAITPITDAPITIDSAYAVDSFYCPFNYVNNNPSATGDSIIVDLMVTTAGHDSGTYNLKFTDPNYNIGGVGADSAGRFVSGLYTPNDFAPATPFKTESWDSLKAPQKYRYAQAVNSTNVNDTDINGFNIIYIPIPGTLWARAGQKVVSCVSFKSSVAYPFGTMMTAANYIKLYAGDPGGATAWPRQAIAPAGGPGSVQCGLIGSSQNGYVNSSSPFTVYGHDLLIPSVAYMSQSPAAVSAPPGFDVPQCAFHIIYGVGNPSLGANSVKNAVKVSAYPNPANNAVTIAFNLNAASNVTVSLTNMVGQVVATQNMGTVASGNAVINTTSIPAGVYVYTVNANGERTTGRVVVAH